MQNVAGIPDFIGQELAFPCSSMPAQPNREPRVMRPGITGTHHHFQVPAPFTNLKHQLLSDSSYCSNPSSPEACLQLPPAPPLTTLQLPEDSCSCFLSFVRFLESNFY